MPQKIDPIIVSLALRNVPDMIINSMLEQKKFINELGLLEPLSIRIGEYNVCFGVNAFYRTVQAAMRDPATPVCIDDKAGKTWKFEYQGISLEDEIMLDSAKGIIAFRGYSLLSENRNIRMDYWVQLNNVVYFEGKDASAWLEKIKAAPLETSEYDRFVTESRLTPIAVYGKLTELFVSGNVGIEHLVPTSRDYYFRLVGQAEKETDFDSFAASLSSHFMSLSAWSIEKSPRLSLLLAAHSRLTAQLPFDNLSDEDYFSLLNWVSEFGDLYSMAACLEYGLSSSRRSLKTDAILLELLRVLFDDTPTTSSRFSLASALIVFVGEQLAESKLFEGFPPFWVRLATIAQASVIERAVIASRTPLEEFQRWASNAAGPLFFFKAMFDLRIEPRWLPDFIAPEQMQYDFAGRLTQTLNANRQTLSDDLLAYLADSSSGLNSRSSTLQPYLPGPLEGDLAPVMDLPEEIFQNITLSLSQSPLDFESFIGISNAALVYKLERRHALVITESLELARYQMRFPAVGDKVFALLGGLGNVAAVTRCTELAGALRILSRVIRRRKGLSLSVEEEVRVALICAAAHEEEQEWSTFLEPWVTEICFDVGTHADARTLLTCLQYMNIVKPSVCSLTSKGEACLEGYLG